MARRPEPQQPGPEQRAQEINADAVVLPQPETQGLRALFRHCLDDCGWLLRFQVHGSFDRSDEPVSQSQDGLDLAGLNGGIAKCLAKLLD
jgi:hypothetical protein